MVKQARIPCASLQALCFTSDRQAEDLERMIQTGADVARSCRSAASCIC